MQRHHGNRISLGVVGLSSPPNPIGSPPVVEEVITSYMRRGLRESIV